MFNTNIQEHSVPVYTPAILFSSFRPVPPTFTPSKETSSISIESSALLDNTIEAVCTEMPKQLQLDKPIWHSKEECPEDFWKGEELRCEERHRREVLPSTDFPTFSEYPHMTPPGDSDYTTLAHPVPLNPPISVVENFATPPVVEIMPPIPKYGPMTDQLHKAWLGTNVTMEGEWTMKPSKEILEDAISRRASIEATLTHNPYDPQGWLELAHIYFELCFNDLQVASAHKAIFLISQGLDLNDQILGREVRRAVGLRLSCRYDIVITDELENELAEAHKALLRGLFEMCAYWDGLKEAKKALDLFSFNKDIATLQRTMKDEFYSRTSALREKGHSTKDVISLSRIGRSFKRKYPWLDDKLFIRSPALLRKIGENFNSTNCEVRPLFALQNDNDASKPRHSNRIATKISIRHLATNPTDTVSNVGPLGVFAKRTIHKGEILLTDYNLTIVPVTVPPKRFQHCDACQALLIPPFLPAGEYIRPPCCKDVAYCSTKCARTALNGYHKLVCGKDFKWLHQSAEAQDPSWQPLALLRILAIVVSDLDMAAVCLTSSSSSTMQHPLQHPLISRLDAGYETSPTHANSSAQVWNYVSHVVAPTRILAQLGVDIFADARWSAEVIHTICWRIVNNACRASSCTVVDGRLERTPLSGISPGYVFFNHSCEANVTWMAAGSAEGVARIAASADASAGTTAGTGTTAATVTATSTAASALGKRRRKGAVTDVADLDVTDVARVGCNAMICFATRDIKKGEEARISYLPPGNRQQLGIWFEGGMCMCGVCDNAQETG